MAKPGVPEPPSAFPIAKRKGAFPCCHWCEGNGCVYCDSERAKYPYDLPVLPTDEGRVLLRDWIDITRNYAGTRPIGLRILKRKDPLYRFGQQVMRPLLEMEGAGAEWVIAKLHYHVLNVRPRVLWDPMLVMRLVARVATAVRFEERRIPMFTAPEDVDGEQFIELTEAFEEFETKAFQFLLTRLAAPGRPYDPHCETDRLVAADWCEENDRPTFANALRASAH